MRRNLSVWRDALKGDEYSKICFGGFNDYSRFPFYIAFDFFGLSPMKRKAVKRSPAATKGR
jgi:hypothetical protein